MNYMSSQPNNASKSTVSNGSTPLARSSSSTQNSGSHIFPILEGLAKTHAMSPDMIGPNGDGCHSTLGYQPEMLEQLASNTLELKYCLVGNDPKTINRIVESHWHRVVDTLESLNESDKHEQITLLFKLAFFCRAIRCQGGRSRVQFYAMFKKLRTEFPSEALSLVSLIPHYGCFQDIDQLVTDFNLIGDKEMSRSLLGVYVDFLTEDLSRLLGSSLTMMSLGDIHTKIDTLNKGLKKMTTSELSHIVGRLPTGQFSLAAKWLKREGKKNSSHRDDLICLMFPTINRTMPKSMEYGRMVLRKCTTALSQCLNVVEQYMTEVIPTRSWGHINFKNVPSVATTRYRLAFANKTKEGLERSEREDRRMCAQNILTAVMDGKINGAQSDLKVLADLIWSQVDSDFSMSDAEIALVNCQWTKMVEFVNQLIEETLEKDRLLRQDAIDAGDTVPAPIRDPRAVIPVVDVSGSMSGANVMQYAIAMGIVCGTISSIPGKLITFSERPEVFSFDPKADIFDIFRKIKGCKWGYNTNLDATYKLLLGEMTAARDSGKSISTDFSTLIVTDGGFDHMVCYEPQCNHRDSYSSFQQRQEVAFTQAAENLLREYEQRLVNAIKKETGTGLEAMYNRSREIAMRLSLIIARSMGQDEIGSDAMQWSIDYVDHYAIQTIEMFRSNMSEGPFEAACKAVYARIEKAGLTGLTERELARSVSSFANMDRRRRADILDALQTDRGIECRNQNEGAKGRPRFAYFSPPIN